VAAGAATNAESYQFQWFGFDNATSTRTPIGDKQFATAPSARAPAGALGGEFVGVAVTAHHNQQAGWARPATFFFRRSGSGWTLVGVERG
jgi:hypothetical protein